MLPGCPILLLSSEWAEERLVLLRANDGLRLCHDGSHQVVPSYRAEASVWQCSRADAGSVRRFVAEARLAGIATPALDEHALNELLRGAVASGSLVVVTNRPNAAPAASTPAAAELRRLVRAVDEKARGRLVYAAGQYKLVADVDLAGIPGRDSYEVVPRDAAAAVLGGLAGQSPGEMAALLRRASDRLSRDWRPPMGPDGLVLLRRLKALAPSESPGPALTPSQMKKLTAKKDWIEIEVVDEEGLPYTGPYRIELPDGSSVEGRFDETGFYDNHDLDPGRCKLVLPEVKVVAGAAESQPAATTPAPPPVTQETESAESADNEFAVKVVDETGAGVAGISMTFDLDGTRSEAITGADGVAQIKGPCEQSRVSFTSVKSLWEAMSVVWQSRSATARDAQPPSEAKVVTLRPASIEDEAGEELRPCTVAPGACQILCVWPGKRRAVLVELHDTLFRTDSAVVCPEGEAPSSEVGQHQALTTVGLIATILRYNEEHEGKALFVAGHADRSGSEAYNQPLSEERGKAVVALLTGDRDGFIALAKARNSEVDVTQVMDWSHRQYGFACKPSTLKAPPSNDNYYLFRKSFNAWIDEGAAAGEARGTKIGPTGRLQPDIWSATFDLYEHGLAQELGEDKAGVAGLRAKLKWVDDSRKSLGFSEHHPVDENRPDGMRSQDDRRVEVMMFDPGEEPDLAEAESDPKGCALYDGATYQRGTIAPMISAKPWMAYWQDPTSAAKLGDVRGMMLEAPGLPSGESVKIVVRQESPRGSEVTAEGQLPFGGGSALAEFGTWFNSELVSGKGVLTSWPKVSFLFSIEAGGRLKKSSVLPYADSLDVEVKMNDGGLQPASKRKYWILNPWGRLEAELAAGGKVAQTGLPPGGAIVLVEAGRLDEGNG